MASSPDSSSTSPLTPSGRPTPNKPKRTLFKVSSPSVESKAAEATTAAAKERGQGGTKAPETVYPIITFRPSSFGDFSMYHCPLQLRQSLDTATKVAQAASGGNNASAPLDAMSQIRTERGNQFEDNIVNCLKSHGHTVHDCSETDPIVDPTTPHTDLAKNGELLQIIKKFFNDQSGGEELYLNQLRLAPHSALQNSLNTSAKAIGFSNRVKPDLILLRHQGKNVLLTVIDIKSSARMKKSHQLQIAFYARSLQLLLDEAKMGDIVTINNHGEVWIPTDIIGNASKTLDFGVIGVDDMVVRESFDLTAADQLLQNFFKGVVPLVTQENIEDVPWRLREGCATCKYIDTCKAKAVTIGSAPSILGCEDDVMAKETIEFQGTILDQVPRRTPRSDVTLSQLATIAQQLDLETTIVELGEKQESLKTNAPKLRKSPSSAGGIMTMNALNVWLPVKATAEPAPPPTAQTTGDVAEEAGKASKKEVGMPTLVACSIVADPVDHSQLIKAVISTSIARGSKRSSSDTASSEHVRLFTSSMTELIDTIRRAADIGAVLLVWDLHQKETLRMILKRNAKDLWLRYFTGVDERLALSMIGAPQQVPRDAVLALKPIATSHYAFPNAGPLTPLELFKAFAVKVPPVSNASLRASSSFEDWVLGLAPPEEVMDLVGAMCSAFAKLRKGVHVKLLRRPAVTPGPLSASVVSRSTAEAVTFPPPVADIANSSSMKAFHESVVAELCDALHAVRTGSDGPLVRLVFDADAQHPSLPRFRVLPSVNVHDLCKDNKDAVKQYYERMYDTFVSAAAPYRPKSPSQYAKYQFVHAVGDQGGSEGPAGKFTSAGRWYWRPKQTAKALAPSADDTLDDSSMSREATTDSTQLELDDSATPTAAPLVEKKQKRSPEEYSQMEWFKEVDGISSGGPFFGKFLLSPSIAGCDAVDDAKWFGAPPNILLKGFKSEAKDIAVVDVAAVEWVDPSDSPTGMPELYLHLHMTVTIPAGARRFKDFVFVLCPRAADVNFSKVQIALGSGLSTTTPVVAACNPRSPYATTAPSRSLALNPLKVFEKSTLNYGGKFTDTQRRFFETVQHHSVAVLWGPPGTGKTFTLANLLLMILLQPLDAGAAPLRVLVVTVTKRALEEIADRLRIIPFLKEAGTELKWNAAGDTVSFKPAPATAKGKSAPASSIHFCTVWAAHRDFSPLGSKANSEKDKAKVDTKVFDVLVIDEASQMPVHHALLASLCLVTSTRSGEVPRLVLAGDVLQLPPIVPSNALSNETVRADETVRRLLVGSVLEAVLIDRKTGKCCPTVFSSTRQLSFPSFVVQLDDSFRSVKPIVDFVGRLYPKLVCTRSITQTGVKLPALELVVVATAFDEAAAVENAIHSAVALDEENPDSATTIGVVVPHRRQRTVFTRFAQQLLSKVKWQRLAELHREMNDTVTPREGFDDEGAMAEEGSGSDGGGGDAVITEDDVFLPTIEVDTVERMQGREYDLIVLAIADVSAFFTLNLNRLNVALSRARNRIVVVTTSALLDADEETLAAISYRDPKTQALKLQDMLQAQAHLKDFERRVKVTSDARERKSYVGLNSSPQGAPRVQLA